MRIFAKIRQVYDRLCERKEASADRMRQEPAPPSRFMIRSNSAKSARDARLDLLAKGPPAI